MFKNKIRDIRTIAVLIYTIVFKIKLLRKLTYISYTYIIVGSCQLQLKKNKKTNKEILSIGFFNGLIENEKKASASVGREEGESAFLIDIDGCQPSWSTYMKYYDFDKNSIRPHPLYHQY